MTNIVNSGLNISVEELLASYVKYLHQVHLEGSNPENLKLRQELKMELTKKGIEDVSVFNMSSGTYTLRYLHRGSKKEIKIPLKE